MLSIPSDHRFTMRVRVTEEMIARFFDCTMHRVYATFALVEHAEYAARMAIRPYLEPHEDALGTAVRFEHMMPTPIGWIVEITATVTAVEGRRIDCAVVASSRRGVIARGEVEQRVVARERLASMLDELESRAEGSNE
jgi:fluoroacetyl-CoA thioesterase